MNMGRFAKILFGVAAVVFLIAPLFAILPLAFTSSVFLTYPVPGWSVRWFEELATADVWRARNRQQPYYRIRNNDFGDCAGNDGSTWPAQQDFVSFRPH